MYKIYTLIFFIMFILQKYTFLKSITYNIKTTISFMEYKNKGVNV